MPPDVQLELFDLTPEPSPRRRGMVPIGTAQIRQDHAVLGAILSVIGLSVVFALGVERGKQLARTERPLLSPAASVATVPQLPTRVEGLEVTPPPVTATPDIPADRHELPGNRHAAPAPRKAPSAPPKAIAGGSRYAIQVVSYRTRRLAHRELQRLTQRGERAFLVVKPDRVALLVGPFPTKAHASTTLPRLRQRYQDCFIRTL